MGATDDNNDQLRGGSEEITSNKKECTPCEQHNIDTITEGINSVAILDNMSVCASCGKEGNSESMNTCNRCKMVKYCNAACKKKHRTKHKKACERRAKEIYDERLFKEIEHEECPICMLTLPVDSIECTFKSCCGKTICNGCMYAMKMSEGKDLCAFCRTPPPSSNEEDIKRIHELINKGNSNAFYALGGCYNDGDLGLQQDYQKANELYLKAGDLGCTDGYHNLANAYYGGRGVEVDTKKAKHYWELAAMNGSIKSRHNLGCEEWEKDNVDRALKHWLIATRAGCEKSLDVIKEGYKQGLVTKEAYAITLRAYQKRQNEMKSDERDKAAIHYTSG